MLAMHLLQSSLVLVNTLIIKQILSEPRWAQRLTDRDKKALTALIWAHVNPYGTFPIDMNTHLDLDPSQPRRQSRLRDRRRPPTVISRRYLAAPDTDPSTGPCSAGDPGAGLVEGWGCAVVDHDAEQHGVAVEDATHWCVEAARRVVDLPMDELRFVADVRHIEECVERHVVESGKWGIRFAPPDHPSQRPAVPEYRLERACHRPRGSRSPWAAL
jgi:Tn3 transposase DDE domain